MIACREEQNGGYERPHWEGKMRAPLETLIARESASEIRSVRGGVRHAFDARVSRDKRDKMIITCEIKNVLEAFHDVKNAESPIAPARALRL
jgi:hypothetical protein